MKISYADYIKKSDVSVLVAEAVFHDLSKKYPKKKIEEVADTTSGGTPLRGNHDYYGGNIPWLKSGELNDGFIDKAEEYITEKGLTNSSAKLHPEGTLLIAMYGATAGKTGITTIKAATNQAICAVFPKSCIERDYLFWFFRAHRYKFIEMSKGGAQPNISQTLILKTPLPLPEKDIQKKIISILESVRKSNDLTLSLIPDEFRTTVSKVFSSKNNVSSLEIELNNQSYLLSQLRQSFLREAMQGKLVKQDPKDGHAKDLLAKIKAEKAKSGKKEKELPPIKPEEIPFEIPENWVWCRLGEICTIKGGKRVPNGYKLLKTPTPHIYIRVSDMKNGTISENDLHYIDEEVYKSIKQYTISKDDIYMTIVGGTIGKCGLVPERFHNMNLTENAAKITPMLVDKHFLWLCLDSPFCQSQFIDKTKQVGVQKMALNRFSSSLVALPPLSEQTRIVERLNDLMKLCDGLQKSIQESREQNELLLQQVLKETLKQ